MRSLVTAGFSDTPTSRAALHWALRHAAGSNSRVVLFHVVPVDADEDAVAAATRMLRRAVGKSSSVAPAVAVSSQVLKGNVVAQLASASSMAGMLVIGSGAAGGEEAASATSRALVAEASCPIVVVPASDPVYAHGVVFGADDALSGQAALAFAASEASSMGQRLTLVRAWSGSGAQDESLRTAVVDEAARRAAGILLTVMREGLMHRHPRLAIDTRSLHGPAREVLVQSSADSHLVVIGASHQAEGDHSALGEVVRAALLHMRAPLAIVRGASVDVFCDEPPWQDAESEGWVDRSTASFHPSRQSAVPHLAAG